MIIILFSFDEVAIGVIVMTAVFVIVIGLCMANMGPADPPRPNRPPPRNRPAPPAHGQQRETPDPDVPEKYVYILIMRTFVLFAK